MKVYEGIIIPNEHDGVFAVYVNGDELSLAPSLQVRNHSPTGFAWGYNGSGPSQLSLAIMLDYFNGNVELAEQHYQMFKFQYVSNWPMKENWKITAAEIDAFVNGQEE